MTNKKRNIIYEKMLQARQELVNHIQEKDLVNAELINQSWENVEKQLFNSRISLRHRFLNIASLAACVAIILSIGLFLFYTHTTNQRSLSTDLLNIGNTLHCDSIQDIVFITKNDKMNFKEDASIQYKADGSFNIKNKTYIKSTTEKQEKHPINHLIVPKGKRAQLTFCDGTKMFVNAGSHIIYPTLFEKNKREIVVEGEVFLDVVKDPKRPFIVKVNGFDVKVLGTSFNICAYREEKIASVVLVNGCVEVKTDRNETVQLLPNQLVNISPQGAESKNVDVFEYICWKDNMMLLSGRKAGDVLNKLARYYGCNITFGSSVSNLILQGKLDLNDNIRDVMDMICLSLSLKYSIDENNTITISQNN